MNHRGELLVDANGQQLKAGATVVDDMFGKGLVLALDACGVAGTGTHGSETGADTLWPHSRGKDGAY